MLPPLNALRAFEAAARHGGYIDAADELCVTRGAVSRHVKLLEEHLGVTLFRRNHRGVELTQVGQALLPELTEAFARIERATRRASASASELRIICPPGLSIRWLFPRLQGFRDQHPDIRVRLTTEFYGDRGFDPAEQDVGISLEHWPGRSADIKAQFLFPMSLVPACAPSLLDQGPPLVEPSDLRHRPLLHESTKREDWTTWIDTFQVDGLDVQSGEAFPNLDMATKAAVLGAGVAMVDPLLCAEELERGLLVCPFPDMVCGTQYGGYAVIGSQDKWDSPNMRAFRDWAVENVPAPVNK
ncbi:LysR substrate-binding domain-containing protein [Falsiruegeria mediterranea]|uniref:Glycine cleavage system transcriptional activator n=1 Tax=Falsiruegeria mediterranea M17 TaxID=1200281 RepID=A0A2R8C7F9_9RHOB|nr:LysR substrate-binding domain-containing protein [Falsiruegeria mediterranea]SPJ28296.1 Glycine cleavage system transcriptional activator [Falsiruegeria mediterranea M17]